MAFAEPPRASLRRNTGSLARARGPRSIDPWHQKERLPRFSGGFLSELIYGDEPRLIDDITELVAPDDPAREYLEGMRSLIAVPHYDQGEGLNMVISMREEAASFDPERFPEWVWVSGLFGRVTHNLVLRNELKQAYDIVERELKVVADIQRSLLPQVLPKIPNLELAAYYRTSRWAGGDYYDFFPLPDGRWGILVADVSGHGTPAAVMMAICHSLAHSLPGPGRSACHAAGTSQPAVVDALHDRQRGLRDRVLCHLRSGSTHAQLFERRPQSAQAHSLPGRHGAVARGSWRAAAGPAGRPRVRRDNVRAAARRCGGVLHRRNHRGHGFARRPVRYRRGSMRS